MENKANNKAANKTVYINYWFTWYGEPNNDGVTATRLPNGRWVCEIKLPLINKTVKSVSSTAANAMENASKKAIPLVEKYLSEHPEVTFISKSQIRHYEFYTDELGFTGYRQNSEYRKKVGENLLKMNLESAKVIEKAVARIKRINGSTKNLFIQVIERSFFDEKDKIVDIQNKISNRLLNGNQNWFVSWQSTVVSKTSVIAIGYIMEMD